MTGQGPAESQDHPAERLLGLFLALLALLVVSTMLASLLAGLTGIAGVTDWSRRILPLWIVGLAISAGVIFIGWRLWGLPVVAAKSLRGSVTGFVLLFLVAGLLGASVALVTYMLLPGPPTGSKSPPGLLAAMLPVAAIGSSLLGWAVGLLYFGRVRDQQLLQAERRTRQELSASKEHLQRRNREMEALNSIAIATSYPVGLEQLAATCVAGLNKILGTEVVAVYLLDEPAQALVLVAQQGIPPPASELGRLKVADTLTGLVSPGGAAADNIAINPKTRQWWMSQVGVNSVATALLKVGGKLLGAILVASRGERSFAEEEVMFISAMADYTALAIESERTRKKMEQAALRDSLTGLYNYGELHRRLGEEMKRASRSKQPLSLLFIDIDNFKTVNEHFGHQVGDQVLSHWASQLAQRLREYDILGRYGGDEFLVVVPGATAAQARDVAEKRLRRAARETSGLPPTTASAVVKLTFSIGIASFPEHATEPAKLIECANQAMFFAKSQGGNGVKLWEETRVDFGGGT